MNWIRKLFTGMTAKPTRYRFPVFVPGEGGGEHMEVSADSYVEARRAVMAMVDTGKYLVGPGVEITDSGETVH